MTPADLMAEALELARTSKVYDAPLPGGRWCSECGITTNHTTAEHERDEIKPDEEPLDDPDDDQHC
jgi:hypothetical protein